MLLLLLLVVLRYEDENVLLFSIEYLILALLIIIEGNVGSASLTPPSSLRFARWSYVATWNWSRQIWVVKPEISPAI